MILKNKEIAKSFNDYFSAIVDNLNLHHWEDKTSPPSSTSDKINDIIKNYEKHPSIGNVETKYRGISSFSFRPVSVEEVKKIIQDVKTNKPVNGEIPTKILKGYELTFDTLTNYINKSIETGYFPGSLKLANVAPLFKKVDPFGKSNYRPVSILPLLSKVYEKVLYNQLSDYSESFLNNMLCGFRKAYSTQHALFKLLQSWQQVLDNGGFIGTVLMDLSKAYDCIPHNLLIAKLECYGVDNARLRLLLLLYYLTCRKQWTKIGSSFSSWCHINTGMPQGSILGPLLFNIFINDLFFSIQKSEVCNFANDNTLFCDDKNLDLVFLNLNSDLNNVMDWFKIDSLRANSGKFQFMVLAANNNDCFNLNVAGKVIPLSSEVKLLGITIHHDLKFKKHINELCRKASYMLPVLQRMRRYLSVDKAK